MEINTELKAILDKIELLKDQNLTEEPTKTSLIMPFFHMLGYDVFNPLEFAPEYTADVGLKKGEKVDYAIILEDSPVILIECKACNENLDKHGSQLYRYFGTTEAKFGILTNGIRYQFFTDLENTNKMDKRPFLEINLLDLKDRDITELRKFRKDTLDVNKIADSAEDLKYAKLIKEWISESVEDPSEEFVRFVLSQNIYDGVKNQKVIDRFTPIIKQALNQYMSDSINYRLKAALNADDELPEIEVSDASADEKKKVVVTTVEELEAYAIVKSILIGTVDSSRITYRDNESYFNILLDDNRNKWICRAYFNSSKKYITINENKKAVRYDINSIDDIYLHKDLIITACKAYLE